MELPKEDEQTTTTATQQQQQHSEEEKKEVQTLGTRISNLKFWKRDMKEGQTVLHEEGKEEVPQYEEAVKKAQEIEFSSEEENYLKNFIYQGGSDNAGRPLIIVVGSALPAKSLSPERLLFYVIRVMDQPVESDYALIYIHTGASSENRPSFAFLRRAYRTLNRKYKKNLKALYIVHPSFWIKATFKFFRPFISNKFWQKLLYIEDINDIYKYIGRNSITLPKIVFDHLTGGNKKDAIFGTPLDEILGRPDHTDYEIPIVVDKCIKYFKEKEANNVQGIFRLSAGATMIQELKKAFDRGEDVSLSHIEDPHVVAGLLKLFLRELPDPIFPYEDFKKLVEAYKTKDKQIEAFRVIFVDLPPANKRC